MKMKMRNDNKEPTKKERKRKRKRKRNEQKSKREERKKFKSILKTNHHKYTTGGQKKNNDLQTARKPSSFSDMHQPRTLFACFDGTYLFASMQASMGNTEASVDLDDVAFTFH